MGLYVVKGIGIRTDRLYPEGSEIELSDEDAAGLVGFLDPAQPKAADPLSTLTVAQLTEALVAQGVTVPAGARKADLVQLLQGVESNSQSAGNNEGNS